MVATSSGEGTVSRAEKILRVARAAKISADEFVRNYEGRNVTAKLETTVKVILTKNRTQWTEVLIGHSLERIVRTKTMASLKSVIIYVKGRVSFISDAVPNDIRLANLPLCGCCRP